MGEEEASRKRSANAKRQARDGLGRFCSLDDEGRDGDPRKQEKDEHDGFSTQKNENPTARSVEPLRKVSCKLAGTGCQNASPASSNKEGISRGEGKVGQTNSAKQVQDSEVRFADEKTEWLMFLFWLDSHCFIFSADSAA
jgi:hypothetical protein